MQTRQGKWRRTMHVGLAGLVLAAMSHCAWEGPAELVHWVGAAQQFAAGDSLPLGSPPGCHNESGCICRGATQVSAFDVSNFSARLQATVDVPPEAGCASPLADCWSARDDRFTWGLIFSGRELRTRMASFLI